jgi:hypothetical protein
MRAAGVRGLLIYCSGGAAIGGIAIAHAQRLRSDAFRSREKSPMRVLVILALALSLAGCNGDRIKQSMNGRQAQPQSTGLLT